MFSLRKEEGGFVCCDRVFFFFFFLLFLFWALSCDLFRCCWKFWAGLMFYMFTCKGNFLRSSDIHTLTRSSRLSSAKERKGKNKTTKVKVKLPFAP